MILKMKKSIIALAVILGLMITGLVYYYIQTLNKVPEVKVVLEDVVVAASSIPAHVKITNDMLVIKSLPVEAVHPDAARKIEDLVGFTTKTEIYIEEQVLKGKVASGTDATSLSYRIPENMRAITIPMNEISGVGGYIMKSDHIDILVTYNDPAISPTLLTITQFQDIEVLEKGPMTGGTTEDAASGQGVSSSLTLLVNPAQAEVIAYALINGNMQMTLRNPVDSTKNELTQFGTAEFTTWRER